MSHGFLNLDELSVQLGRDRRELEKLVSRGRIPGQRVEGEWRFHPAEIRQWLEQAMREYSDTELTAVEESHRDQSSPGGSPLAGVTRKIVVSRFSCPESSRMGSVTS